MIHDLSSSIVLEKAFEWAPSNIALVKYWGKRDETLNLPTHGSLSLSLGNKGTWTKLSWNEGLKGDQISFNGQIVRAEESEALRLTLFLDHFRPKNRAGGYELETVNDIPMAAGLASSASGFAALVKALNALHGWKLDLPQLSLLARLGSGSASRSLYQGFALWHEGSKVDGSDSFAEGLDIKWPQLRWLVFMPSKEKKSLSSRLAMKRAKESCPWFSIWIDQSRDWLKKAHAAVCIQDFKTLGEIMEASTLSMHATMLCSNPWHLYWKPETLEMMQRLKLARQEGLDAYFTMDAGPSVKILYLEKDQKTLEKLVQNVDSSSLMWVNPWDLSGNFPKHI